MKRFFTAFLLLVPIALFAGCIEVENQYTVNPDGSGKVKHKIVFIPKLVQFGRTPDDPEEIIKNAIKEEIQKSKGITAWKDVSYKLRNDGKIEFSGVGYFQDINNLQLHNQGYEGPLSNLRMKQEDGTIRIRVKQEGSGSGPEKNSNGLSGEKLEKKIKLERAKFAAMKSMLAPMKEISITSTLNLPGAVSSVTNFEKVGDRSARLTYKGDKIFKIMEEIMNDDDRLKSMLKKGKNPADLGRNMGETFNKLLFKEEGPIEIKAKKGEMQFSFEKEVKSARKEMADLKKKIGLTGSGKVAKRVGSGSEEAEEAAKPMKGGKFKSLNIASLQMSHIDARRQGLSKGLQLTLMGELPGRVREAKGGTIKKAVSAEGEDLLPEKKYNQSVRFPRLNDSKTSVRFRVNLKYPSQEFTKIRELSGVLKFTTGGKTESIDLGINTFKKGASGKKYSAKIKSIEKSRFGKNRKTLKLTLGIKKEKVESVTFYDGAGNKLDVNRAGYSSMGGETTLHFRKEGEFPDKGSIKVQVIKDLATRELPFKLTDVNPFSPGK